MAGWLALACPVLAQAEEPLRVDLVVQRAVVDAQGKITWQDGQNAQPGDKLRYTATYANQSERALSNVKALIPIPAGVKCLLESVNPAPFEGSFDGQTFLPWPQAVEKITQAQQKNQTIPTLRQVRWLMSSLPPGAKFTATVSGLLESLEPVPTPGPAAVKP